MDGEAMMRAGRARRDAKAAPKGGGYANGGRVGKAAYSGESDSEPQMRRGALKVEVESGGYAKGGRVGKGKGRGC